jgi:hypothetical protein
VPYRRYGEPHVNQTISEFSTHRSECPSTFVSSTSQKGIIEQTLEKVKMV